MGWIEEKHPSKQLNNKSSKVLKIFKTFKIVKIYSRG